MDESLSSVSFLDRTPTNPSSDDDWTDVNQYFFVKGNQYKAADLTFCDEDCIQETEETDSIFVQPQAEDLNGNQKPFSILEGNNLALIINNYDFETRVKFVDGAYNDTSNLFNALSSRKWQVEVKNNGTKAEIDDELERFRRKINKNTRSILVFISSHGQREGNYDFFLTADGGMYNFNSVLNMFSETECPILAGKPKLFLASFCRKSGVSIKGNLEPVKVEDNRNMLIAYATSVGCASYMTNKGSWFITSLTKAMKKLPDENSVEVFKRTNRMVSVKEGADKFGMECFQVSKFIYDGDFTNYYFGKSG